MQERKAAHELSSFDDVLRVEGEVHLFCLTSDEVG